MEAVNGFVFDRGVVSDGDIGGHSYLVSFVIVTDRELVGLNKNNGETVVMGGSEVFEPLCDAIDSLTKYRAGITLGDASSAIMKVSKMVPGDLERV